MIEKEYQIKAKPLEVFNALTNSAIIEIWSGSKSTMSDKEGEPFSLWEGSIHGVNVEVGPTKIMQQWKEKSWADFSEVTILIAGNDALTNVTLKHDNVPNASLKSIDTGWDQYYFGPLKAFLETK